MNPHSRPKQQPIGELLQKVTHAPLRKEGLGNPGRNVYRKFTLHLLMKSSCRQDRRGSNPILVWPNKMGIPPEGSLRTGIFC